MMQLRLDEQAPAPDSSPSPRAGAAAPPAGSVPLPALPPEASPAGGAALGSKTVEVAALTSTGKDDWRTPRAVLDSLDAEFAFGLDAAAAAGSEAFPGRPYLGPGSPWGEDALAPAGWKAAIGGGPATAWLNPPYSKAAGGGAGILAWHRRAWEESRDGLTVVILCPPHPGRGWFWRWARRADEVRVYTSRLAFVDPATGRAVRGNTQDSCLVIYRSHVTETGWSEGPEWSWISVPK